MKKSIGVLATDSTPGTKNAGIEQGLKGREIYPDFRFDASDIENRATIKLSGWDTGSGNRIIRAPFHFVDSARNSNSWQHIIIDNDWTLDVLSTSINTGTFTGGIVDGITLAAFDDLLIWAFIDPFSNPKFKGFGMTVLPKMNYTAQSNGAKGSNTVYTLSGAGKNVGYRIGVGARVICRQSTSIGAEWNQGTVTATAGASITVTMDSSAYYGTALTVATGEIVQTDLFEPRMSTVNSLYPNAENEYAFAYMGNIRLENSTKRLGTMRKRGDYYYPSTLTLVGNTTSSGLTHIDLGQWAPHHTREVEIEVFIENTSGEASDRSDGVVTPAGHSATAAPRIRATTHGISQPGVNTGRIPIRAYDAAIDYLPALFAEPTLNSQLYLIGWKEDRF